MMTAVRGQILTIGNGFLVFTNGAALRLGDTALPKGLVLGRTVRVTLDPQTHVVTKIEVSPPSAKIPGEIDSSKLSSNETVGNTSSSAGAKENAYTTVTINVTVPVTTPVSDDVYLSTERTGYSAAELRMNRVDATNWSIQVDIPSDTQLHYRFTRGTYQTSERDRGGAQPPPHLVPGVAAFRTHDVVERWADQT